MHLDQLYRSPINIRSFIIGKLNKMPVMLINHRYNGKCKNDALAVIIQLYFL